jgi:uncharacterized damage-inducible protein DinB
MRKGSIHIATLHQRLAETTDEFIRRVEGFTEETINASPSDKGWSAAQVAEHVTKSNLSIAKALRLNGSPADRDPAERIGELQEVFLDFKTKLQSPSFILPSDNRHKREAVVEALKDSVEKLHELARYTDLSAMIDHPAFGDITKLEIIHFVIYHTQRHCHQLQNISGALGRISPS